MASNATMKVSALSTTIFPLFSPGCESSEFRIHPVRKICTRQLIRHTNDIPVLAAAIRAKPNWFITDNIAHFNYDVAKATGLIIVTPKQFLYHAGRIFPL